VLADSSPEDVAREFAAREKLEFKTRLADVVIAALSPIRDRMDNLPLSEVEQLLERGRQRAEEIAAPNMDQIRKIVNL
jgi:hypothetical protein